MTVRVLALLSLLTLPAAAQTAPGVPATPPAPTAPLPTGAKTGWTAFLQGGAAELLGLDGRVIGTVQADGSVTLSGTLTLADVKAVRVTPPAGQGEPTTYAVTRDLSRPGAIKLAWTGRDGKAQSLPLPALLHRLTDTKDKEKEKDQDGAEAPDDAAPGDAAEPQAAQTPPAQGKGHGKKK